MEDYLKIVVTGEVDSGKSTLIGRFLYETGSLSQEAIEQIQDSSQGLGSNFEFAYLLDSFEEERKGQLTIDTTQVFCKTKKGREFVFIDVPGHQALIKNMLCGSSYADTAILVVDVQKSIEPQTKRHAFILKLLGIEQIIIVLNKMDLVGFSEVSFKKIKEETIEFLKKAQLQPQYFIPISAKQGDNLLKLSKRMSWYKSLSLNGALNTCFKRENNGAFRFPIQDIYNNHKEKVAVGKILSGEIKKGEKVNVLPLNKELKVEAIKVFNSRYSVAKAPESIGLVLDDMDGLRRGQIIAKPRLPQVKSNILAKIFCVHSFNTTESLRFKCLTQETTARIKQIISIWDITSLEPKQNKGLLEATDFAKVSIITEDPMAIESFTGENSLGRFVLQNNKEICAVGIIL